MVDDGAQRCDIEQIDAAIVPLDQPIAFQRGENLVRGVARKIGNAGNIGLADKRLCDRERGRPEPAIGQPQKGGDTAPAAARGI